MKVNRYHHQHCKQGNHLYSSNPLTVGTINISSNNNSSNSYNNKRINQFNNVSRNKINTFLKSNEKTRIQAFKENTKSVSKENKYALDRLYFNVTGFPFPLGPFLFRKTIRYEIIKDKLWTFEQPQTLGFSSVTANIRMTVIKLNDGNLWVHGPVAPTKECLDLIKELNAPVTHIILPTFAYEHKIFVGPFSRKFPRAKVYVAPNQWSWPINLPLQFFGIFPNRILNKSENDKMPWSDEIDFKIFKPPDVGIGPYVEVVFYHKASQTLIVTDCVVYVPKKPLDIIPKESLLFLARNDGLNTYLAGDLTKEQIKERIVKGPVKDTPQNIFRGWMRSVLLVLYFGPFSLLDPEDSFKAICERWLVSPVLKALVYSSIPKSCVKFVMDIEQDWKYKSIIPAHLAGPIKAKSGDVARAFSFSFEAMDMKVPGGSVKNNSFFSKFGFGRKNENELLRRDYKYLDALTSYLRKSGAIYEDIE